MFFAMMLMLTASVSANAMSYEQARNEALFLTDKMAYELNLTDEQYEAAYEINLDYLMGVTSYDDVYGTYWERRNRDLSYVLLDAQWQAYIAASYFYRPLYWSAGYWHFGIYARYPHRDYFFFGRPVFYATYRGAHAWHLHGTHGYYYSHRHHFRPAGRTHFGMLDRWNRGDYRHHHGGTLGHHGGKPGNHGGSISNHGGKPGSRGGSGSFGHHGDTGKGHDTGRNHGTDRHRPDNSGGPRTSSTRTTVNHSSASFGGSHSNGSFSSSRSNSSFGGSRSSGSFGSSRSSSSSSSATRGGFGGGSRSSSSHSGGSRSGGSFGRHR